jgi:hypothetical protein
MCAIRTTHRRWRSSSPPSPRKPIIAVVLIRATATSAGGIQTNNVATYDRGYIYIVDRADTGPSFSSKARQRRSSKAGSNSLDEGGPGGLSIVAGPDSDATLVAVVAALTPA